MERQGEHLYSLPSALRKRGSNSTLGSSTDSRSRSSYSPEMAIRTLPSSSTSSLAESTSTQERGSSFKDWSLMSINRVNASSGMVLVALYHLPTSTLYTWPLQTDPKAPQPKQGTVFIAPSERGNDRVTSESLKVLTTVLLNWMRQGASQLKTKAKLGERSEDTDWLRSRLQMPRIHSLERQAILEMQSNTPVQEWSAAFTQHSKTNKGKQSAVLGSLNTNVTPQQSQSSTHSKSSSLSEDVPMIEVTSPNSSDYLSNKKSAAPWLTRQNSSRVH